MFTNIRHALASWLLYRHTVHILHRLDRRLLEDNGIERGKIKSRAREATREILG